jgi:hypothetical protein
VTSYSISSFGFAIVVTSSSGLGSGVFSLGSGAASQGSKSSFSSSSQC